MSNASLSFVAWVRQGAASAIKTVDGPSVEAVATVSPSLVLNSTRVDVPIRLRGPADVLGIDPNQIVRTDPRPGTVDFESNCFAAIEFDRPDFPWLFTPARADGQHRLRPWLCLVVVARQTGVTLDTPAGAPLPVLHIAKPAQPSVELPDLTESWAWAHAQTAGGEAAVAETLNGGTELSLSRLICPRILAPQTEYLACVVPAFEQGRIAGLGPLSQDEITAALQPAWSPDLVEVSLPVYYHWEFRTGEGGDFGAIAKALAPSAPADLGQRVIDISHPGFTGGGGKTESLQGALKLIEAAAPFETTTPASFQTKLAGILNAPGKAEKTQGASPVLAPPIYGRWHAGRADVAPGGAGWLDQLNLDPSWRAVAGFGTRVVQEHQEALMASAWEQAADLQLANQRLRQLQMSRSVGEVLHARHFGKLDDEAMLRVAAPAMGRIGLGEGRSMLAQQAASPLPMAANGSAMRRIGRARGPLSRRVASQGGDRAATPTWVGSLAGVQAPTPAPVGPTLSPPPVNSFGGMTSLFSMGPSLTTMPWLNNLMTAMSSFQAPAAPAGPPPPPPPAFSVLPHLPSPDELRTGSVFGAFFVVAETEPLHLPGEPVPAATTEIPGFFRDAAQRHLTAFFPPRPAQAHVAPPPAELKGISAQVMKQTVPADALRDLAQAAIATGDNVLAAAPPGVAANGLETIMAAPRFPAPMYEALRDLSQDLLIPGLEAVERETVVGLQTNRPFVEAYMVGLNHEMGRELLWRGFPTDQRGTYFARFWNRADPNAADIEDLHKWRDQPLGASPGSADEAFVLLLRSRLLARYPNAVIYMTPALPTSTPGVFAPDPTLANERMPIFDGGMQPDVRFFGFPVTTAAATGADGKGGYFVVIQEHPTEPRFGIDFGSAPQGASHLAIGGEPPKGVKAWNAAQIAGVFRRRPTRVAIHARRLITHA